MTVEVYQERYWEVFDPHNAEVIAHVFDERYARMFADALNALRKEDA